MTTLQRIFIAPGEWTGAPWRYGAHGGFRDRDGAQAKPPINAVDKVNKAHDEALEQIRATWPLWGQGGKALWDLASIVALPYAWGFDFIKDRVSVYGAFWAWTPFFALAFAMMALWEWSWIIFVAATAYRAVEPFTPWYPRP